MLPIRVLDLFGAEVRPWVLVGWVPFFFALVALHVSGVRRGWSVRGSLLATAAFAVGMSLGVAGVHSVVGAIAGGVFVWLVVQRALGLTRPPLGTLALALAGVLAVGRVGCLLGGCCFGTPTELPWAVHYDASTAAWLLHHATGAIASDAPRSLGVHPYPLYESLGLLAWIAIARPLRRRLASEGALLALTASFDLALRAVIDGWRAMINVTWALEPTPLGIDRFRLALALASLACAALALGLERRARRSPSSPVSPSAEASAVTVWIVYVALAVIGLATDAHETRFLHGVFVLALLAVVPVLPLPRFDAISARHVWGANLARACALAVLVPLVLQLRGAEAGDGAASATETRDERAWVYEVDARRERVIRIGRALDGADVLQERRLALGLPLAGPAELAHLAATSTTSSFTPRDVTYFGDEHDYADAPEDERAAGADVRLRHPRLWIGASATLSTLRYTQQETCSGNSRTWDRSGGGGFVQAEGELPVSDRSVFWVGGRLGTYLESISVDGARSSASFYYLQAWGEWEHPYITLGGGGAIGVEQSAVDSAKTEIRALPGLRLRLGARELGIEGGLGDRGSHLGPISGHLGLSGMVTRAGTEQPLVRYGLAAETFGGARVTARGMGTGSLEYYLNDASRLAFTLSIGEGFAGSVGFFTVLGSN